jgi:hypothetical protein
MQACKTLRPLFVMDTYSIFGERGKVFKAYLESIFRMIQLDFQQHLPSLTFLFTRFYKPTIRHRDTEDYKELFNNVFSLKTSLAREIQMLPPDVRDSPKNKSILAMLDEMMSRLNKEQSVLIPMPADDSPDAFRALLLRTEPIANPQEVISSVLSASHRNKLYLSCERMLVKVATAFKQQQFGRLRQDLERLNCLAKYTSMECIRITHEKARGHVLREFQALVTEASRSFHARQFHQTRKFLDNLDEKLFRDLAAQEPDSQPGSDRANQPFEKLLDAINSLTSELQMVFTHPSPKLGKDDFYRMGADLESLHGLCDALGLQQWLQPQFHQAYEVSLKAMISRIMDYDRAAAAMIDASTLANTAELTLKSSLDALKAISDLKLRRKGEPYQALYATRVQHLLVHTQRERDTFEQQLAHLELPSYEHVAGMTDKTKPLLGWVQGVALELFTHADSVAHLSAACTEALQKTENHASAAADGHLISRDYANLAGLLRVLDLVTRLQGTTAAKERFSNRLSGVAQHVEITIARAQQAVALASECKPVDFRSLANDLSDSSRACAELRPYLEEGRAGNVNPSSKSGPGAVALRDAELDLTMILSLAVQQLGTAVDAAADRAVRALAPNDTVDHITRLSEHALLLESMVPLASHVPNLSKHFDTFGHESLRHIRKLCEQLLFAANGTRHVRSSFSPLQAKELLDLLDSLEQFFAKHCARPLGQELQCKPLPRHEPPPMANAQTMQAAEEVPSSACAHDRKPSRFTSVLQDIVQTRSQAEAMLHAKISDCQTLTIQFCDGVRQDVKQFKRDNAELVLQCFTDLQSMARPLDERLQYAPSQALENCKRLIAELLSALSVQCRSELQARHILLAESLAECVRDLVLVKTYVHQVEHLAEQLMNELILHKGDFARRAYELLQAEQYPDLANELKGHRHFKTGTGAESKQWLDIMRSLAQHFRTQYDAARLALDAVALSRPPQPDQHSDAIRKAAVVIKTFASLNEPSSQLGEAADSPLKPYLLSAIPDFDSWLKHLRGLLDGIQKDILSAVQLSLNRYQFGQVLSLRKGLEYLCLYVGMNHSHIHSLDATLEHRLNSLDTCLDATIFFGYRALNSSSPNRGPQAAGGNGQHWPSHSAAADGKGPSSPSPSLSSPLAVNDGKHVSHAPKTADSNDLCNLEKCLCSTCVFVCECDTDTIDDLFSGLRSSINTVLGTKHDFADLYKKLQSRLNKRVEILYKAASVYNAGFSLEKIQVLVNGCRRLLWSQTLSSGFFNQVEFSKLECTLSKHKEAYFTQRNMLRTPVSFQLLVTALHNQDFSIYQDRYRPEQDKVCVFGQALRQTIELVDHRAVLRGAVMHESLAADLRSLSRYEVATFNHVDELDGTGLFKRYLTKMHQILSYGAQAREDQNPESLERYACFVRDALPGVDDIACELASLVSDVQAEASLAKLCGTLQARVDDMRALARKLKQDENEWRTWLEEFIKNAKTGWLLVANLDLTSCSPSMTDTVQYVLELRSEDSFFSSSTVPTTAQAVRSGLRAATGVPPAVSERKRQQSIAVSYANAIMIINKKFDAIPESVEALFDECVRGSAKLVTVLENLSILERELPGEIKTAACKASVVQTVMASMSRIEATAHQYSMDLRSGRQGPAEIKATESKLNRAMEDIDVARKALSKFPGEFPDSKTNRLADLFKSEANQKQQEFVAQVLNNGTTVYVEDVATGLIDLYKISSRVSDPSVSQHVRALLHKALDNALLPRFKVDAVELADVLQQSTLGSEIVADFDQFRLIKLKILNAKIAGMNFDDVLLELQRLATSEDGKCSISEDNLQLLRANWLIYETLYRELLNRFLQSSGRDALYTEAKRQVRALQNASALTRASESAKLLAYICAVVTLQLSVQQKQDSKDSNQILQDGLVQPHPVQVVSLFRLLGIDQPVSLLGRFSELFYGPATQNHLIQILTGQGKSIVLGVMSVFLALFGLNVDCVCYSKYLSLRDYEAFKCVFVAFAIEGRIRYSTFSELSRHNFNAKGDIRKGVKAFMEGKLQAGVVREETCPDSVLLIDEVDNFFSPDFYGALYTPSVLCKLPQVTDLLQRIWVDRAKPSMTVSSLKASSEFKALVAVNTGLQSTFELALSLMYSAAKNFDQRLQQPEFKYHVDNGKIGYLEHGVINFTVNRGYHTGACLDVGVRAGVKYICVCTKSVG